MVLMKLLGDFITTHIALSIIIWLIAIEICYVLIIRKEKRHTNIWLYSIGNKLMALIGSACIIIVIPMTIDLIIQLYNNASYVLIGLGACLALFVYLWINKLIAQKLTTEFKSLKLKKGDKLKVVEAGEDSTGLEKGEIVTFVKRQVIDGKKCLVCKTKKYPNCRKNSHGGYNGWLEWRFEKA